jgi:putative effector of murein hydrolase
MPRILELTNNGYIRLENDIILNYGNIIIEILFYLTITIISYIITHILLDIKLFNVFSSPITIIIAFIILITIVTKGYQDYSFSYRVYVLLTIWLGFSLKIMLRFIKQKCKQ